MTKTSVQLASVLAAATMSLGGLSRPASADICAAPPKSLPYGLTGAPHWLASDGTTASPVRTDINDPRWANAARKEFANEVDENVTFRVAYQEPYLMISFQVIADAEVGDLDAVYFGIGNDTTAHALRLSLPVGLACPVNGPVEVPAGYFTTYSQSAPGAEWEESLSTEKPVWLESPAAWINQIPAGASAPTGWGVNFKVDLLELGYAAGTTVRLFHGARVVDESVINIDMRRQPDTGGAQDTKVMANEEGPAGFGMIPKETSLWLTSQSLGALCEGIHVPRFSMGVKDGASFIAPLSSFSMTSGEVLQLIATPRRNNPDWDGAISGTIGYPLSPANTDDEFLYISDGEIAAEFRIANWGSVTDPSSDAWLNVTNYANPAGSPRVDMLGGHFDLVCEANNATETCGIDRSTLAVSPWNPGYSHQCMLVEMRDLGDVNQFGNASEYRNMDFEIASTVQRTATIDVRGLQALTGTVGDRDIYLYVSRRNMPAPTSEELVLPQSEMYARRFAVTGEYTCSDPERTCLAGQCAYACEPPSPDGSYDDNPCGRGKRLDVQGCWCTDGTEVCYPRPSNDYDIPSAESDEEKLAEVWPYINVRVYYDTGIRAQLGGTEYKSLQAMYPFGLMIDHTGPYYGFTSLFEGVDGVVVEEVAPDVFKLTVEDEGVAHINMTVEALELNDEVPLNQLHGAATRWGTFGTLEMVSMIGSDAPIDLSTTTVTINSLLEENGVELVTNLGAPVTLEPLPFSQPSLATFVSTTEPSIVMEVIDCPLLGRLTVTAAAGVNVAQPEGCSGWFGQNGTALLDTSFTLDDGVNQPFTAAGEEEWQCAPFSLVN